MIYIKYKLNTGAICLVSNGDDAPEYDSSIYGQITLDKFIDANYFYVKNGEITPYPTKPDNSYKYNWNGENWVLDEEHQANLVKAQRDLLLSESDWVVTKAKEYDQEVSQNWKDYRQALRDIPQQSGFPLNVVFPEKPEV